MGLPVGVTRLIEGRLLTFVRYCGVSVVSVVVGQTTLLVGYTVLGFSAVVANLVAVVCGTTPAYFLNRSWAWGKTGRSSLATEVVPFFAMAFLGLLISTLAVAWVERRWDQAAAISAANFASFGVVWVARFFVLDAWLFRVETAVAEPIEPATVV